MLHIDQSKTDLHQTNARLEAILDNAGLGIWDYWVEADKVVCDKRLYKMLGLDMSRTQLDIATIQSLLHPDDIEQASQALVDHIRNQI